MSNPLLFILVVLIWGSTWIGISYQTGHLDPALSVGIRFGIAACLLGIWGLIKGLSFRLPWDVHKQIVLVGILFYTLDYTFLYAAQQHIISALLALLSSSIIYINVVLRRILLGKPMRLEVIVGATLGMIGVTLIFIPEFKVLSVNQGLTLGLLFAAASFLSAGVGNVVSEKILDKGTPVVQMNFFAMTYSLIFTFGYAFLSGAEFYLPNVASYYYSLIYLAVFGSVIAFGAYMQLLRQIGSDKAAYVVLVYPLIALIFSTFLEGYTWTWLAASGVALVLIGNAIAMGKLNKHLRIKTAEAT